MERVFDFGKNADKATVLDAIANAQPLKRTKQGGTATPEAIEECLEIFGEQGQPGIPQVIMVFSDGVTHYRGASDEFKNRRLNEAVNKSIEAGTINFAIFFTDTNPVRTQEEALIIAQRNQERAIYDTSFDAIEHEAVQALSCRKCSALLHTCTIETYVVDLELP